MTEKLIATVGCQQRHGADIEFAKGARFINLEDECLLELRKTRDWMKVQVSNFYLIDYYVH